MWIKNGVDQETKNVATKTLTEVGNRGSQKVIDKIIPPKIILPRKGRGLTEESKNILNKYLVLKSLFKKKVINKNQLSLLSLH